MCKFFVAGRRVVTRYPNTLEYQIIEHIKYNFTNHPDMLRPCEQTPHWGFPTTDGGHCSVYNSIMPSIEITPLSGINR